MDTNTQSSKHYSSSGAPGQLTMMGVGQNNVGGGDWNGEEMEREKKKRGKRKLNSLQPSL